MRAASVGLRFAAKLSGIHRFIGRSLVVRSVTLQIARKSAVMRDIVAKFVAPLVPETDGRGQFKQNGPTVEQIKEAERASDAYVEYRKQNPDAKPRTQFHRRMSSGSA